jgi:hypothetical protein
MMKLEYVQYALTITEKCLSCPHVQKINLNRGTDFFQLSAIIKMSADICICYLTACCQIMISLIQVTCVINPSNVKRVVHVVIRVNVI